MTIEIKIPSDNLALAAAIGAALSAYGAGSTVGKLDELAADLSEQTTYTPKREDVEKFNREETIASADELNDYELLAKAIGAGEDVKKIGVRVAKAIGVYEQVVLNQGFEPKGLDELADLLNALGHVDLKSSETILDAIYKVTAPAETAVDTSAAFTTASSSSPTSTGSDGPATTDEKGVPFNADFCGKAAKPFYGSGKTKGQWKKRQGVDAADYDNWYADELSKVPKEETVDKETGEISTAAAFTQTTKTDAPKDMGGLFTWISEMQNAGRLTQANVDQSYAAAGVNHGDGGGPVTMNDIITGNESRGLTPIGAVNLIYGVLAKVAGV